MNLLLPFAINTLWSFKRELFYISLTFLMVLLLPIIAVVTITQSGIEEASDALVSVDAQTKLISLYYPNGALYKELSLNIVRPMTGTITHEFGEPLLPFYLFHNGLDISNKRGTPIRPFLPGKVTYAGQIWWGYGKHVIVDHGENITSIYAHLDTIKVKEKDEVTQSTIIGTEGSTGWSTGPHLHFQINVFGIPVNPKVFL